MFLDASAMVAILAGAPERPVLLEALDLSETAPLTSAIAIFETVAALSRKKAQPVAASQAQVDAFLFIARVAVVPLGEAEADGAGAAFGRYGKDGGHSANLNLGECFAYACARIHDRPLLFIGDGLARTDIASGLASRLPEGQGGARPGHDRRRAPIDPATGAP